MSHPNPKNSIKRSVVERLSAVRGLLSLTFVGSFEHSEDLSSISDIDIIVIVNELTEIKFAEIQKAAALITGEDCDLPGFQVRLNMTFGPLKFYDSQTVVFHLMVYDLASHRNHVNESPFTCFDWEQYEPAFGKSLRAIYPVNTLQISDLVGTRRSLNSYMADIQSGVITYREYEFNEGNVISRKRTYEMDERHKKEYSFHIMKFLMVNTLKIFTQENRRWHDSELAAKFSELDKQFYNDTRFFLNLAAWKHRREPEPQEIFVGLESFLTRLSDWLTNIHKSLPVLEFFRHARTPLNDGSFLGTRRNPEIIKPTADEIPTDRYELVITGTLVRTIATGKLLSAGSYEQTALLNEIDYGDAEGIDIHDLKAQYPDIISAWLRKEDPLFPGGECQGDVSNRLNKFLKSFFEREKIAMQTAIITHNVVIRTMIGTLYKLPVDQWFRVNPGHIEGFRILVFNGDVLIPEFKEEQRITLRDQIVQ